MLLAMSSKDPEPWAVLRSGHLGSGLARAPKIDQPVLSQVYDDWWVFVFFHHICLFYQLTLPGSNDSSSLLSNSLPSIKSAFGQSNVSANVSFPLMSHRE